MNPTVIEIIERTMRNTTRLLEKRAVAWPDARAGVFHIVEDLSARDPSQKAAILGRVGAWAGEMDMLYGVAGQLSLHA